jgi:uncharacterized protein YndB with AHSA1/START domain
MRLLTVSRRYDATADEVWDALTNPERLPRWFLPVTGDLEPGGHYQLEGNAAGEILVCQPRQRLSISWFFGEQESWVEVTLYPGGENTLFRLEHTLPIDDHWTQYGPGAVGIGWELTLMGLAEHLADDTFTPPTPDQLPDMSDFVKASSDTWAQADIAAGTDPKEAWAAAERCLAAYTGQSH